MLSQRHGLLLHFALRTPERLRHYSLGDWTLLVRQARSASLLARLALLLDRNGLSDVIPQQARWHFDTAKLLAERQHRAVQREAEHLSDALAKLPGPCVLLKGAAYVMASLPAASGRMFNDIDLLIPRDQIDAAESALMLAGWHAPGTSPYDERYYRKWMHEIPPLQHIKRLSTLDLHHAILPLTARTPVDTAALLTRIERLPSVNGFFVLGREDRVLHSATHLFHDGELPHGLRDLSDLDLLLRAEDNPADFWSVLLERAHELNLGRSLYYGVHYARHFFDTPIPEDALQELEFHAPRFGKPLVDAMFRRALAPLNATCEDRWTGMARSLAYIRAHWLRMPAHLLLPHLYHKAVVTPWEERKRSSLTDDEPAV